jgi:two-component system, NtrC family, response regulator AtoC
MSAPTHSTIRLPDGAISYELMIASADSVASHALAGDLALVIGRTSEADVKLEGAGVSRRHAILRAAAGRFTIEDLGSSNGTRVRGQPIAAKAPVELAPGEAVQIGDHVIVVRPRHAAHVWTMEYLEARLVELYARSGVARLVHVATSGIAAAATAAIASVVSPLDTVARVAAGRWAVLLGDPDPAQAIAIAGAIQRALVGLDPAASTDVLALPDGAPRVADALAWLAAEPKRRAHAEPILQSAAMKELDAQLEPIARSAISVLLLGETGVGKDVMARRIHERSSRAHALFVRLTCVALTEPLLESELFGYERGAFGGVVDAKPGLLETAGGGTVFLDEVGELPLAIQGKLLQVIESQEVLRVGALRPRPIDVRFIAATSRDLTAAVTAGAFRADLYYRIAGFVALIPPLRARRDDILPLARELIRRASERHNLPPPTLDPGVEAAFLASPWPGNVRELRNLIERAVVLASNRSAEGRTITLRELGDSVESMPSTAAESSDPVDAMGLSPTELAERQRIIETLVRCMGNQERAAAALGWSRSTLLNRLDAYRIARPRKRPKPTGGR